MLNDIYWIKFGVDGNVECICLPNRKECPPEKKPTCREYVAKFDEIHREHSIDKKVINKINKQLTEIEKNIKKGKIRF